MEDKKLIINICTYIKAQNNSMDKQFIYKIKKHNC